MDRYGDFELSIVVYRSSSDTRPHRLRDDVNDNGQQGEPDIDANGGSNSSDIRLLLSVIDDGGETTTDCGRRYGLEDMVWFRLLGHDGQELSKNVG
jgi:hypothetical protein